MDDIDWREWWSFPLRCRNGHPWRPGTVTVSWIPCRCPSAQAEAGRGHMTVRCGAPGCPESWYKLPLEPARLPEPSSRRRGTRGPGRRMGRIHDGLMKPGMAAGRHFPSSRHPKPQVDGLGGAHSGMRARRKMTNRRQCGPEHRGVPGTTGCHGVLPAAGWLCRSDLVWLPRGGLRADLLGGHLRLRRRARLRGTPQPGPRDHPRITGRTGRLCGRPIVDRFARYVLITKSDVDRAERFFAGRGAWAVPVGRMLPFVRAFTSLVAGLIDMPALQFGVLSLIGTVIYATVLTLVGYAVGSAWGTINHYISLGSYVIVAVAVIAIAAFVLYRLREFRKERAEPGPSAPGGPAGTPPDRSARTGRHAA